MPYHTSSSNAITEIFNEDNTTMSRSNLDRINCVGIMEILEEINRLDSLKSSGIPHLNDKFLKMALQATPDSFLHIINRCLSTGTFPSAWKISTAALIPKKGNTKFF